MATTSPDNIWTPDAGDDYALTTDLATTADTVQAGIQAARKDSGSLLVANAAARDAWFPTPVQGNRVWRSDKGYEETYYGTYNSTTNPGGAVPAGWYPSPGAPIGGMLTKTSTPQGAASGTPSKLIMGTVIYQHGGMGLSDSNNSLVPPVTGLYRTSVHLGVDGSSLSGTAQVFFNVWQDGTGLLIDNSPGGTMGIASGLTLAGGASGVIKLTGGQGYGLGILGYFAGTISFPIGPAPGWRFSHVSIEYVGPSPY